MKRKAHHFMAFLFIGILAASLCNTAIVHARPGGVYNSGMVVQLTAQPAAGFTFNGWSGDLSGSDNPAGIAMNASKTVLAKFTPTSSGNQVVLEEIQTGASSNEAAVTTSANLIGVQDHLYLAAISTKSRLYLDGVTGLGLNWTLLKYQCSGRGTTMVELWMAQGMPSSNGPVTAILPTPTYNAVIVVSRYSGASNDPIGSLIGGSTNGEDAACVLGVDGSSYSFYINTTGNDAIVYGAAAMRDKTHTPGAGYTERVEVSQGVPGSKAAIAVQDRKVVSAGTANVNGAFNGGVDWAVVAVEIKPNASMSKRGATAASETFIPSTFQLEANYPNPFNPETVISFQLPVSSEVKLAIYSITGQLVRTLVDGEMAVGRHSLHWDGRNELGRVVVAGMYLYKIVVESENGNHLFTQTRRITLLK